MTMNPVLKRPLNRCMFLFFKYHHIRSPWWCFNDLYDFDKAFGAINHGICLRIVYIIVFPNHNVEWFQSYLSNRTFTVNLETFFLRNFKHTKMCARINTALYYSWSVLMICQCQLHLIYFYMPMTRAWFSKVKIIKIWKAIRFSNDLLKQTFTLMMIKPRPSCSLQIV